jgi:hypothetical protein
MERHGAELSEVCIVVPNRRAGLFIRNIIADNATGPVWAPTIFAQDDFMAHLSGYTVVDRLTQLFYFYEIYMEIEGEEAKAFADFIHWAPTLLADFNEIDQYLADTRQLFAYLNEAKAIDLWNMGHELTDFQKKYLHFWGQMKQFYAALTSALSAKGLAYQGMAYRKAAENLEEAEGAIAWQKVYFLGFNALTMAEEQVMKYLTKIKKAEIFWDADSFYIDNPNHEAGKFLRKYRDYFGEEHFNWVENHLSNPEKEIEIIGVSGNAAQAKLAGQILEDLSAERGGKMVGTALVLADEGLLLPVLNSLPQNIDAINVTMGYPLKYTPVASFIDAIFSLHISSFKFSEGRKEARYYHKDIATLASHPLFSLLTGKDVTTNPLNIISKKNYVFLSKKLVDDLFTDEVGNTIVFNPSTDDYIIDFVNHLLSIVTKLKDKLLEVMETESGSQLTLEYLYTYHRYLKKLKTLLGDNPLVADLQTLRLLFNQLISNTTIPFYGEPLRGLQVMGMLETRTLDFENIVLLSANEGVLPQGKAGHSFIPFDIKREYELPTYSDKDSIFGYHFYRLLQRAKKVWILYSTQTDGGIGGKEKSRFITQLVNELKGPKIEQKLLEIPLGTAHDNVISFKKTPAVIAKLTQIGQGDKGFSPSALTMFIRCPLQFYFRYVAGLKENEEVEETLEAATMGTVIHAILEKLFTPYKNQLLRPEHIETMQGLAPMVTDHVFNEELGAENYQLGKNLLIYRVSKRFVENFLAFQKQLLADDTGKGFDTVVTNLEQPLAAPFNVGGVDVKIAGMADRIEQSGNDIRIIDYKTGKVDNNELKFSSWDDLILFPDYAKSFQLLTYAWLFHQSNPGVHGSLRPSIVAFTKLSDGLKECITPFNAGYITDEDLVAFEGVLNQLLTRLFNTEEEFYQTPEKQNCRYCIYNSICNRN